MGKAKPKYRERNVNGKLANGMPHSHTQAISTISHTMGIDPHTDTYRKW